MKKQLIKSKKICIPIFLSFIIPSFVLASPESDDDVNYSNKNIEEISKIILQADLARDRLKINKNKQKILKNNKSKIEYTKNPNLEPVRVKDGTKDILVQGLDYGIELPIKRVKTKGDSENFKISLPNKENRAFKSIAKISINNTIIYKDYEESTDVAIQSFNDSLRILTILNNVSSPSEYKYDINIPSNSEVIKGEKGEIFILNEKGGLIIGLASPWAIDSEGREVSTYYEISNNSITQVVEHLENEYSYPIVADPWMWKSLISYASWNKKPDGWTLSVKPTWWARINNGYYPASAGWDELYSKYKNRGLNYNLNSMKNQYICHPLSQVAIVKDYWNLDEWRPNVGLWKTIRAACNP